MLEQAAEELDFDTDSCYVIGDKASDVELGQRVGAITFQVTTGHGTEEIASGSSNPDYTVGGLDEAADIIEMLLTSARRT